MWDGEGFPGPYDILWHPWPRVPHGQGCPYDSMSYGEGFPSPYDILWHPLPLWHHATWQRVPLAFYDIHDEGFPSHYDMSHGKGFPWPYDIHGEGFPILITSYDIHGEGFPCPYNIYGEGFPCPYNILWHPWWRVPLSLRHHVTWRRVPLPYDIMWHPWQRVLLPYDIMWHPWQRVTQKGHQTDVIGRPTEFRQFIYACSQEAKFWEKKQTRFPAGITCEWGSSYKGRWWGRICREGPLDSRQWTHRL